MTDKISKKSSYASKLLQATALAAVLVPLGSITAEGASCTYTSDGSGGASFSCATGPEGGALFQFTGADTSIIYSVELGFDNYLGGFGDEFEVEITDIPRSQGDLAPRFGAFQGSCVPINPLNTASPCVEFAVDAPEANLPGTWESSGPRGADPTAVGFFIWVYWLAETDAGYPNPMLIHDTSNDDPHDPTFDINITIPGSYTTEPPLCVFDPDGCGFSEVFLLGSDGDPAIGGKDNDFSSVTLVSPTAVPEPASMLLLGTGISGLLYRRRMRNRS